MTTSKSPLSQKEKLMAQLHEIELKIKNLEKQRADKVAKLAKKHKITELDDSIIEKEFIELRKKYAGDLNVKDNAVKKSLEESAD